MAQAFRERTMETDGNRRNIERSIKTVERGLATMSGGQYVISTDKLEDLIFSMEVEIRERKLMEQICLDKLNGITIVDPS